MNFLSHYNNVTLGVVSSEPHPFARRSIKVWLSFIVDFANDNFRSEEMRFLLVLFL